MSLPIRRNDGDRPDTSHRGPFGDLSADRQPDGLDPWRALPHLLQSAFTPVADVEETPEAYLVEIELPGLTREDIDIEIAGQHLTVRGERKEKERVGILRRRERTVGRFCYEVTVPGDVEDEGVEASLDDGVLHVRLPKPERERPRRIEIR